MPLLWLWAEQKLHQSLLDFAAHCLLWQLLSCITFVVVSLGLPTNMGVGQSWLLPASSIKFLTRESLKSHWVYLGPHEGNWIQKLSAVTEDGKTFRSACNYIKSSKTCWPYDQDGWCNSFTSYTVSQCEVSRGDYFCYKKFLLLVVGLY
jgi:hypothetical protein